MIKSLLSVTAVSLAVLASPVASNATRMHSMQTMAPAEESGGCSFYKYHGSYDPTVCGAHWRSEPSRMGAVTTNAFAVAPTAMATEPDTGGSCNFRKYHGSWDPTQC
jgi:hypothetical protein